MRGEEAICSPYTFTISALSVDASISLRSLLGKPTLLELLTTTLGAPRPFHGYITAAEACGSDDGMSRYKLTLQPWTVFVGLGRDSRVFHEMTVIEILETVFAAYRLSGKLAPVWRFDRFSTSKPKDDAQFINYVTNPVLPALVETLFPSAKAPTNFPRSDLVTVFLKGLEGVNQPKNVVASEMLRLNTTIAPTAQASQNPLGVAGGDNAGFPNGRRLGDDIVDVSLRVAMGALCTLTGAADTLKVGCKPADAPAGGLPLTDGVRKTAADFNPAFPYLNTPLPGNN